MLQTKRDLNDALIYAIKRRDLFCVQQLVINGADIEAADEFGYKPLVLAVRETREYIFLKNRQPQLNDDADDKEESIVKFLVSKGANIEAKEDKRQGHTAFIQAVVCRDLSLMKYFVSKGVNIEATDNDGFTPLLVAVETDELYLTKYLVSIDANVFAKNNAGQDVIALARGELKKFLAGTLREKVCRVLEQFFINDLARFIASYVY